MINRDASQHSLFGDMSRTVIQIEEIFDGVIRHVDVEVSIVVEICQQDSQPFAFSRESRRRRHIFKGAISKSSRRTDIRLSRRWSSAGRMVRRRPVDVMSDVQVGNTVPRNVPPRRTGTPLPIVQFCILGCDFESSVSRISKQRQPSVARDQQIDKAILVVVGRSDTVRIMASLCQPR